MSQTNDHRHRVLDAAAKHLRTWFIKIRKIKGIYHTLNLFNFDVTNKYLIAEAWIPERDLPRIKIALCKGTVSRNATFICLLLNFYQKFVYFLDRSNNISVISLLNEVRQKYTTKSVGIYWNRYTIIVISLKKINIPLF